MRTAAVIGCGRRREGKEGWAIGHAHAAGYLAAFADLQLTGVDPDQANRHAFAERFDLPEDRLFASTQALYAAMKPQVVSICTWPSLHAEQVIEAAEAGVRGIICEKPMAMDPGEIERMLDACRRHNVRLAVAHQRAYDPSFVALKRLIGDGAMGRSLVLEARVGDNWDMLSWSVHWFDMAAWLFDADARWVLAGVDHSGQRRYQHAVEDASIVLAQFPDQRQAVFITGPQVTGGSSFIVRGEDGMAAIQDEKLLLWNRDGFGQVELPAVDLPGFAGLAAEMFSAIEQDGPLRLDASRSARATLLAFAAHESACTQRRVHLPPDFKYAPLEVLQRPMRSSIHGRRCLLLADDHFGSGGRAGLSQAIEAITGIPPRDKDAAAGLSEADLADVDVLLLYHTQRQADADTQRALTEWVESGRPLVAVHAALGAWPGWSEYRQWIGRHWVCGDEGGTPSSHPHEASELETAAGDPLNLGLHGAWLPRDEVFINLADSTPCIDGLTAQIPQGSFPAAWRSAQRPNVAVWVPGHRGDIWRLAVMRWGLAALVHATEQARADTPGSR